MLQPKLFVIIGVVSLIVLIAAAVLIPYVICRKFCRRRRNENENPAAVIDEEHVSEQDDNNMVDVAVVASSFDTYQVDTVINASIEDLCSKDVETSFYHAKFSDMNGVEYLDVT